MKQQVKLTLGGEELVFRFDMGIWERLEDEICTLDELGDKMNAPGRLRLIAAVTALMTDRDPEWVWANMKPAKVSLLSRAITATVKAALRTETEDEDEETVDVTLEELEKNLMKGA